MVEVLVPIVAMLSTAFVIVGVAKILSDGRTRRRLIDAGATPELATALAQAPRRDPGLHDTLRWGLVTGALGVGLIVIQFLPYGADQPIVYGVVLLFGAGGLLGYYAAARRLTSN